MAELPEPSGWCWLQRLPRGFLSGVCLRGGAAPGAPSAEHPWDKSGGTVGRRGWCPLSDVKGFKYEVLN